MKGFLTFSTMPLLVQRPLEEPCWGACKGQQDCVPVGPYCQPLAQSQAGGGRSVGSVDLTAYTRPNPVGVLPARAQS